MSAPTTKSTPETVAQIVALSASGYTHEAIASACKVSVSTIKRVLAKGDAKQRVAELRAAIRAKTLEGVKAVTPKVLKLLDKTVTEGKDLKGIDALARATHALEKTAASASGENKPETQQAQQVIVQVLPGWSKGDGQMATVQQPPPVVAAKVIEVKPVETPQSAAMAKLKAMHQAGELD